MSCYLWVKKTQFREIYLLRQQGFRKERCENRWRENACPGFQSSPIPSGVGIIYRLVLRERGCLRNKAEVTT